MNKNLNELSRNDQPQVTTIQIKKQNVPISSISDIFLVSFPNH